MPLLSVITPVFNSAQFIELCIQNVISQQCGNDVEHIIVDGGSSDGTIEVIEKYAKQYSHIKWLSEKDKGQSDAMNKGIKMAKGEYISFLNADDYYSEGALNEVIEIIGKKNTANFIVGNCNVFDVNQQLIYVNKPIKLKPWHLLAGVSLPVNPSAYFYKKSLHDSIGMYNEENHYNMDIEFLIKTSLTTEMKYIDRNWGNFRLLPTTKTASEIENNLLGKRKKELFTKYLRQVSFEVKLKTRLTRQYHNFKKHFQKAKKLIALPFNMVYWKMRKTIKTGKLN